jgi:hypothetical protein
MNSNKCLAEQSTDRPSARFLFQALADLSNASVSDACILDDCIVISAHTDSQFRIHIFKVDKISLTVAHARTIEVDGEVTCLSPGTDFAVLAGVRKSQRTFLAYGSLRQDCKSLEMVDLTDCKFSWISLPCALAHSIQP